MLSREICFARSSLHTALGELLALHTLEQAANPGGPRVTGTSDAVLLVVHAIGILEGRPIDGFPFDLAGDGSPHGAP
jgi:hypothetical protein